MGVYEMTTAELLYYRGQLNRQTRWVDEQLAARNVDPETVERAPRAKPADQLDLAMRNMALAMDRMTLLVESIETRPTPLVDEARLPPGTTAVESVDARNLLNDAGNDG